jgi:hypothetical protein
MQKIPTNPRIWVILVATCLLVLPAASAAAAGTTVSPVMDLAAPQGLQASAPAFPSSQAGFVSYVRVPGPVNLTKAVGAFSQLLDLSQTHAIGTIWIPNHRINTNVSVYVDTTGSVVAFFYRANVTSEVVKWGGINWTTPQIALTTDAAIEILCPHIDVDYTTVKDDIGYYHYGYPNAERMLIFLNTLPGGTTEFVHIFIPSQYSIYEASYSLDGSGWSNPYYPHSLSVDGLKIVSTASIVNGLYDTNTVLTKDVPHTIATTTNSVSSGGSATVLVYREP